jgi:hypothetical protein
MNATMKPGLLPLFYQTVVLSGSGFLIVQVKRGTFTPFYFANVLSESRTLRFKITRGSRKFLNIIPGSSFIV